MQQPVQLEQERQVFGIEGLGQILGRVLVEAPAIEGHQPLRVDAPVGALGALIELAQGALNGLLDSAHRQIPGLGHHRAQEGTIGEELAPQGLDPTRATGAVEPARQRVEQSAVALEPHHQRGGVVAHHSWQLGGQGHELGPRELRERTDLDLVEAQRMEQPEHELRESLLGNHRREPLLCVGVGLLKVQGGQAVQGHGGLPAARAAEHEQRPLAALVNDLELGAIEQRRDVDLRPALPPHAQAPQASRIVAALGRARAPGQRREVRFVATLPATLGALEAPLRTLSIARSSPSAITTARRASTTPSTRPAGRSTS